jgi:hypothetical protein
MNCGLRQPIAYHELLVTLTDYRLLRAATGYYEGRVPGNTVRRLLAAYELTPTIKIDSNWKLTWVVEPLLQTWPQCRVLHLVRDPRAAVSSCMRLNYYGVGAGDHLRGCAGRGQHLVNSLLAEWHDTMPAVRTADWSSLSVLQRNCVMWSESQRLAGAVASVARGRYSLIRLEDIVRAPEAILPVFDLFELRRPAKGSVRAALRARANAKRYEEATFAGLYPESCEFERWPVTSQTELHRLCGEMGRRCGYVL